MFNLYVNMITAARSKFIKSLQIKKYRQQHNSFLVQGAKNIIELMNSDIQVEVFYLTHEFVDELSQQGVTLPSEIEVVNQKEVEKHSTFSSNNAGFAIGKIPQQEPFKTGDDFIIALDNIRDPGNLGTIIRICDWYGIQHIICSEGCVDFYSPKVISASMGSFSRVKSYYCDLSEYLERVEEGVPVLGAVLGGENIHQTKLPASGIVVIGSESHGISESILPYLTQKLMIPRFGGAESLNAGIACAIICDHLQMQLNA